ncbi:hypothetical protein C8J56DRAFT_1165741 [Mycena floridula]|nr:hypothetical protein C8J56DRAFT_1165741 [Mycena floridula]
MLFPQFDAANSTTPFVSSPQWRKPGFVTTPDRRMSLAQAALEQSVNLLNSTTALITGGDTTTTAMLYSQMARFDQLTNQTVYRNQLKSLFPTVLSLFPDFVNLDDTYVSPFPTATALIYGYAAAIGYSTYHEPEFLEWAQQSWNFGMNYTLSQPELDGASTNPRNYTLEAQCAGITMAGGCLAQTNVNGPRINSLSTGSLLVMSALLAESTSNATYLTAARTGATFMHSHLLSVQNIVLDSISAQATDNCSIVNNRIFGYNQGLTVEGLAVLASLDPGDVETQNLLYSIIVPAVTSLHWHVTDGSGIITDTGKPGSNDFVINGVIAAYNRNPTNEALRSYLRDYIGVQYNAVLDLATTGNDIYSESWIGASPTAAYSPFAQRAAISVLLAGISVQNDTASAPVGTSSPAPAPAPAPHKSKAGPIAGGIVGGLFLVAVIISAIFFLYRRRRGPASRNIIDLNEPAYVSATRAPETRAITSSDTLPPMASRLLELAPQPLELPPSYREESFSSRTVNPGNINERPTDTDLIVAERAQKGN